MDSVPHFASSRMLAQTLEEVRAWHAREVALCEKRTAAAHADAAAVLCVAHRVTQRATVRALVAVSKRGCASSATPPREGLLVREGIPLHREGRDASGKRHGASLRLRQGFLCWVPGPRPGRRRANARSSLAVDSCGMAVLPLVFLLATCALRMAHSAGGSFDVEPGPM